MKLVIVAGPPSTGKTSVIIKAIEALRYPLDAVGVVKFDCQASDDASRYAERGIRAHVGISADQCPDHFFASNIARICAWAASHGIELLVVESAGLCNRCSPYVEGVPALCVVDCLSGHQAPAKMGPLLRAADTIVLTKGDMVSQAEREVLALRIEGLAPHAKVRLVNGLTGQGACGVLDFFLSSPDIDTLENGYLRFPMPSALCSYCLGQTSISEEGQLGNVKHMEMPSW